MLNYFMNTVSINNTSSYFKYLSFLNFKQNSNIGKHFNLCYNFHIFLLYLQFLFFKA